MLGVKTKLKDAQLEGKSAEIKLTTCTKQIEMLNEQSLKFQNQLNETTTKAETFERELQTLREIMKQQEQQKKEYISKLKRELDMVEQEWQYRVNQVVMTGEDYRSSALQLLGQFYKVT